MNRKPVFVGLLGGMQMISEPLHQGDYADILRMTEILNPPAPEKGYSHHGGTDKEHTQFGFTAHRPWGSSATVLLWNPKDTAACVPLDSSCLELSGKDCHIWPFWDERYLGKSMGGFSTEPLHAHGSVILKVMPDNDDKLPLVVGSNLHISMGAAEIADILTSENSMKICLTDAGARDGKLFICSNKAMSVKAYEGLLSAEISSVGDKIWVLAVNGRKIGCRQFIELSTL